MDKKGLFQNFVLISTKNLIFSLIVFTQFPNEHITFLYFILNIQIYSGKYTFYASKYDNHGRMDKKVLFQKVFLKNDL